MTTHLLDLREVKSYPPGLSLGELRYGWYAALNRMWASASQYPLKDAIAAHDTAGWFIDHWGDMAEAVGMQPAHLFSRIGETTGVFGRWGLAWRWQRSWDVLCFPRRNHIVVEATAVDRLFAFRFDADGGCTMLTGDARREVLGAQIELAEAPGWRQQATAHEVEADAQAR